MRPAKAEARRALVALLLGAVLGAIVGLLARRSPGDAEAAPAGN